MVSHFLGADTWLYADVHSKQTVNFKVSVVNDTAFLTFELNNSQVRINLRKTDLPEIAKKIENFLLDN